MQDVSVVCVIDRSHVRVGLQVEGGALDLEESGDSGASFTTDFGGAEKLVERSSKSLSALKPVGVSVN